MITYHRVKTDDELKEILELQKINLAKNLREEDRLKEGFVTLQHSFDILQKMNNACEHCVAKNEGKVIGFVLSMLQSFRDSVPLLVPMFKEIDTAVEEKCLSSNYIVMGQVCVDKSVRGKGVFRGLYNYMTAEMKNQFDTILTEVDTKNLRSSNAHKSVGFELLKKYKSNKQISEIFILKL